MIKAIIFDRHGVFDRVTSQSLIKTIQQYTPYLSAEHIQEKLQEPRSQYDLGILEPSDFRSITQQLLNMTEEQIQICRDHLLTIQPIQEIRNIIPELQKSYTLGILSDCPKDKKNVILKQYNKLPQFPYQFRSCDYVKSKSQWSEFFEIMYIYLQQDKKVEKPEHILFVDDTLSNVQHAQHLEMMGCHFHTINDLRKFIHR